jgi:hypothetical protein
MIGLVLVLLIIGVSFGFAVGAFLYICMSGVLDDDSFTLNPDYTLQFCDLYEKSVGKPFFCQSRADFIVKNPAEPFLHLL